MGKAVPKGIKSKSLLLMKEYPELFSSDFEHNKQKLVEMNIPFSKTNRNLVIGYITRKIRQHEILEKTKAEVAKKIAAKKTEKKEEPAPIKDESK